MSDLQPQSALPPAPPLSPVLDAPQTVECDDLEKSALYPLANPELRFVATGQTDLRDLLWPWANALYARSISIALTVYHGDDLVPMVNRYFPGYQETILGSESLIISKRLLAPWKSADDRSVLWAFECQAEADLLVRFDVTIDWGEPLTQRMVDGLLVAQRNPGSQQGIYSQANAESTRIFGNPHGQPDSITLDDGAGTATLVYHVLVNGIADVILLLCMSDVGEQVAWNGFLAMRDAERAVEQSETTWADLLYRGRIWTPDTRFNHAVQAGKAAALKQTTLLRTGVAPATRRVQDAALLVDFYDSHDATQSRNLLAHMRRLAERSDGRFPEQFPTTARGRAPAPGRAVAANAAAYLGALHRHLERHPNAALLEEHAAAVTLVANALIAARHDLLRSPTPIEEAALLHALRAAATLAALRGDQTNQARWQSEVAEYRRRGVQEPEPGLPPTTAIWLDACTWTTAANAPWHFANPWLGVELAARLPWQASGIALRDGHIHVEPAWMLTQGWEWWALQGLTLPQGRLTLVWDGVRLHSTLPVVTILPHVQHESIRALHTEETEFDLTFEFRHGPGREARTLFRPRFARE